MAFIAVLHRCCLKWHGSWKTTGKVSEWTCVTGQSDFHIITELNRFLLVTVFFGLNHNPPEWLVTVGFWTSNGEKGFAGLLQSTRRPPRSLLLLYTLMYGNIYCRWMVRKLVCKTKKDRLRNWDVLSWKHSSFLTETSSWSLFVLTVLS